jgi:hypothetical protein
MLVAGILSALLYLRARDWSGIRNISYALSLTTLAVVALAGNDLAEMVLSEQQHVESGMSLAVEHNMKTGGMSLADTAMTIDRVYSEGGEASGRIRLHFWSLLINRMFDDKMWLGSGFAGPYLFNAAIGSAHSQYVDILFRAGPLGLVFYLGLWAVLIWRCFGHSVELGAATVAWFIFGFFNETTKYSYGAFLFFCLLSFARLGWARVEHSSTKARVPS